MESKDYKKFFIAVLFVGICLNGSYYFSIYLFRFPTSYREYRDNWWYPEEYLIIGTNQELTSIDPIDTLDTYSYNIILQVCETLFWNDVTDPELPIEPLLVDSYEWISDTQLFLELKDYIWFHYNNKLDAEAVKWNVDRWLFLTNSTGDLPSTMNIAVSSPLFYCSNGEPIIKNCTIHGDYNLSIYLNKPFSPFLSLLANPSSSIIAPLRSYETRYLSEYRNLIGTGPFKYDHYHYNDSLELEHWGRYWGPGPYFEVVAFNTYESYLSHRLLSEEIDMVIDVDTTLIDQFISDPDVHVEECGSFDYNFLSFNYGNVNKTWRKALTYSFNYTHVINNIAISNPVLGPPAIPQGMPGHNASVQLNLATFDVQLAREIIQSMGFGTALDSSYPGNNESEWQNSTFRNVTFFRNQFDNINEELIILAEKNWQLIGVKVIEDYINPEVSTFHEPDLEKDDIFFRSYYPSYVDGYTILNPLFNINSSTNFEKINDSIVNDLLFNALREVDNQKRYEIYQKIQYILFEREYVHIPLFSNPITKVHTENIEGYFYNSMDWFYVGKMYRDYYY